MTLETSGLHVALGGRMVLRGIDITARPGEVTAIVGPNGSGKTTLMRALTGDLPSDAGEITLCGQSLSRWSGQALAEQRAVLPQAVQVAFAFSLREIVEMGRDAGAAALRPGVVEDALRAVDLERHRDTPLHRMSGGEQQRAHLARALAQVAEPVGPQGPRWLFLDEPVASLDIAHQLGVMQTAQRFAAGGGGVVTVMHDLNLTAMFAQHVILMQAGQVLAAGPVAKVLTSATLSEAYGCHLPVSQAPADATPFVLPHPARLA